MPERGRDVNEVDGNGRSSSEDGRPCYGRDGERKVRREIANCNERRRMQSINAGFQSLRKLLQGRDRDKLSKASVLQKAVEYIYTLERERSYLLARNANLMRRLQPELGRESCDLDDESDFPSIETIKRCKMDTESSDEGIGIGIMPSPQRVTSESSVAVESLRKQVLELQRQLDEERRTDCLAVEKSIAASRCRDKICSSNASATVSTRRGSLETIVEAIRCLEGDSKTSVASAAGVCLAATNDALVKEEYVLGDVLAAAEALQFIAARRQTSASTTSSAASTWQRQKKTLADSWRSCL